MIRVLVVEEYDGIRRGIQELLADLPGVEVVAHKGRLVDALEHLQYHFFDVIILSAEEPNGLYLGVLRALKRFSPATAVLILGLYVDARHTIQFLQAGAHGYIPKECAVEELSTAVQDAAHGKQYLPLVFVQSIYPSFSQ